MSDRRAAIVERAQVAKNQYAREVTAIRQNRDLTPEAKARQIAAAYGRTGRELEALRKEYTTALADERDVLVDQAFGLPSRSPAYPGGPMPDRSGERQDYRQALSIAESAGTSDRLIALLGRAKRTGDALLIRAIGSTAYERQIPAVLAAVAEADPDIGEALAKLSEFDGRVGTPQAKFSRSTAFSPPSRPAELDVLRGLADTSDVVMARY